MNQGEIWIINLDPTIGAEIQKTRPAIIVNDNAVGKLPLKIIVPLSDWKERYEVAPWMVHITPDLENRLSKASVADCFQVRSISEERFVKRLGQVDSESMVKVRDALALVLSIS
jgi:mRNA interferase MazF